MVRHQSTGRYPVNPRHMGIPACQLPMGGRPSNSQDAQEYRHLDKDTLLCLAHQWLDDRVVVYGEEHGGLGG